MLPPRAACLGIHTQPEGNRRRDQHRREEDRVVEERLRHHQCKEQNRSAWIAAEEHMCNLAQRRRWSSLHVQPMLRLWRSTPPRDPTRATSRPSRTQAMPSASTTRVCQRDQGRRSSRAGMSVSTTWFSLGCAAYRRGVRPTVAAYGTERATRPWPVAGSALCCWTSSCQRG